MTLIGNAIKAAKVGAKAVTKYQPFYSAADKAALALTRSKGTGKEFMTELKKTKGVKPAEIEHRKLEQIEQLPKMTKEQFLAELEKRPPAEVSENVLEPRTKKMRDDIADELFPGGYDYTNYRDLDAYQRQQVDEVMATRTTAYGDYQIPGGENYREILLQLPHFMDEERLMYLDAKRRHGGLHPVLAGEYEQLKEQKASFNPEYLSRHWEGNPNVLAHMRVSDRTTPEGKKILHVEEIQSDWHQEGREKGYKPVDYIQQSNALDKEFDDLGERRTQLLKQAELMPTHGSDFTNLIDEANSITSKLIKLQEQRDNIRNIINYGVPDAPFKKNWHELAMKRLINYASENGYDGIAITPGVEQANRYKMSSHIDNMTIGDEHAGLRQISWIPKGQRTEQALKFDKEGNVKQSMISELHGKNISDIFGKDLAEKIVQSKPYERIEGVDLDVGGKGMQGFYDKMLPDYLNQFGKPYGAQVELGGYKLKGDPSLRGEASERLGLAGERFDQMTPEEIEAFNAKLDEANAKNLHYFPITPQMREEVTQKGLPLYQQIGIPLGAGTAGTQVEVPQAPVQPEPTEEPAYAMGGAVYDTTPDMSDGGQILQGNAFKRGGKVHITDNPDTMFMELHDKKLAGGGLLKKALQAAKPVAKAAEKAELKFPQKAALDLAQQRAALPISKGGLGLPANNTAADRAKAMGFDRDTYHGTFRNIKKFDPSSGSTESHAGKGIYSTDSPEDASLNYASIYGPDVSGRVERGLELRDKDFRKIHSRMRDQTLSPRQQEIILQNTVGADNLGVVYPLKVRSDKSIHLDAPESNPVRVGPFEHYDEATETYVDTPHTEKFNEALDEFRELGGDANPIYETVQDYGDAIPARDVFNAVKETGDEGGLYDPYTGDIVSGGVAAGDFMKHFGIDEIRHTPQFTNHELNIGKEHTISFDPDNVRSRFAAFDPWRRTAAIAAALGVEAPDLLADEPKSKDNKPDLTKRMGGLAYIKRK